MGPDGAGDRPGLYPPLLLIALMKARLEIPSLIGTILRASYLGIVVFDHKSELTKDGDLCLQGAFTLRLGTTRHAFEGKWSDKLACAFKGLWPFASAHHVLLPWGLTQPCLQGVYTLRLGM